jgi:phosphatidylglycerophosphate synthase
MYYVVNAITLYRLLAVPLLLFMVMTGQVDTFKWLLAISFMTDAIDGFLARLFKVTSVLGARLDSIADDLTVAAGMVAVIVFKPEFLQQQMPLLIILLVLFLVETTLALIRYRKFSSFHTYSAKFAALMQGIFFILLFFLPEPLNLLFYITFAATAINLIEEIILVILLPEWKTNVKGVYWVMKKKRES